MSKTNLFQELIPALKRSGWSTTSLRKQLFGDDADDIAQLCQMMMESDGEFSSLLISEQLLTAFEALDGEGLLAFFQLLNDDYDIDAENLSKIVSNYSIELDSVALKKLLRYAEPKRQELLRRLNLAPGGIRRLVKMREKLQVLVEDYPELAKVDVDFRHLFNSWFNRGFLVMQDINWTSPAHVLEKIIAYEAVHEIGNWEELRCRLEPKDRYCYAFFHPAMEDEPLVFVEVALTREVPEKINEIIGCHNDSKVNIDQMTCAIFYSISNCHSGLAGVSFGNFLIKQVAAALKLRFPGLKKFATISPVPSFRYWLENLSNDDPEIAHLLDEVKQNGSDNDKTEVSDILKKSAASYFLKQKNQRNEPLDPVARFHLKNGAKLDRLNCFADMSEKGWKQSFGLMVNYVYDLSAVEENHENYMKNHEVVCSNKVRKWSK